MIVRELLTRLAFSADESKVKSFDNAVMGLQKSLLAVVGAATAAGAAAFSLASASARYGDEVAKTARQIGFSTDALQEYRFAFDRLGVSEGEATSSLERFNRRLGEARRGSGSAASEFDALGISLRDANGEFKSAEALLPEIADAMARAEDAAERAAIANSFFGRSGGALAMALAEGGDEIERLREEFRLLGGGLTEDQAKAAEEFTDAMTNMRTVLNGIRLQIGAELMPVFRPMIEAITQFIALNRQIILTRAHDFFQMLSDAMRNLMAVAERIIGVIGRVVEVVSGMDNATQAALAVVALWLAWRRFGRFIMAAALFTALEDIGAWMEGQPSLIGKLLGPYEEFAEAVNNVVDAIGGMENVIKAIIGLALLKWIIGVTGAVGKLAAALGFAGVAAKAGAAGAAAGAAWGASFRAAAAGAIGGVLRRLLGVTAIAAPLALGGSTRQLSDDESDGALQQESARQQQLQQTRERIARGEDPEVVVREHFQEAERQTGQQFTQDQRDAFRDRLLRELQPPAIPPAPDPLRPMTDVPQGDDATDELRRFLDGSAPAAPDAPDAPADLEQREFDKLAATVEAEIQKLQSEINALELEIGDIDVSVDAPEIDGAGEDTGGTQNAIEHLKKMLDQIGEMSFDLNAPPELETLSGDIDNSVANTSLDFNVTQNITVPPGTTAEQLATIRAETRRALEREVNNAARALET